MCAYVYVCVCVGVWIDMFFGMDEGHNGMLKSEFPWRKASPGEAKRRSGVHNND